MSSRFLMKDFSPGNKASILKAYKSGKTQREIGKALGVSRSMISNLLHATEGYVPKKSGGSRSRADETIERGDCLAWLIQRFRRDGWTWADISRHLRMDASYCRVLNKRDLEGVEL